MEAYVCPSDRQLALRARLGTGWSTFAQVNQRRGNTQLSNTELDHIYRVLQRNDSINEREERRVDFMFQRLENMRITPGSQTKTACNICGREFGLLVKCSTRCADCGRLVCNHCSTEYSIEPPEKTNPSSETSKISPSRYLPPRSSGILERPRGSRVLQRLFRSENQEGLQQAPRESSPFSSTNAQHKAFSLDRRRSHSLISGSFTFPYSFGSNTVLTQSSNRFRLCKLCTEAREIWKRSGAWFHKPLPMTSFHSSCPSSPLNTKHNSADIRMNRRLVRGPSEHIPSISDNDWTRIEKRPLQLPVTRIERFPNYDPYNPSPCTPETLPTSPERMPTSSNYNVHPSVGINNTPVPTDPFQPKTWTPKFPPSSSSTSSPSQSPTSSYKAMVPLKPDRIHHNRRESHFLGEFQSPRRGTQSKVQSLFPEVRYGKNFNVHNIAPTIPTPPSDPSDVKSVFTSPKKMVYTISEAPLGTLNFSIMHDVPNSALHVRIHNAKNLIAMDANGLSDPFVVCYLLPVAGKPFRTRTIPQTLNPVWNETYTFGDFDYRTVGKRLLRFAVLDEDTFGADWLGEYRCGVGDLVPNKVSEFAVPLNPRKPLSKEIDDVANPTRGKIQIALRFIEDKRQLGVEVIRCADLLPMDHNGLSDPFVKLYLRPDKTRKTKQKTKVKTRTVCPEFHEEFFFSMSVAEANEKTLELTVWDFDRGVTNDFIGGLTLGATAKAERREVWQAVLRPPYRRLEAWFTLASLSDTQTVPEGSSSGRAHSRTDSPSRIRD